MSTIKTVIKTKDGKEQQITLVRRYPKLYTCDELDGFFYIDNVKSDIARGIFTLDINYINDIIREDLENEYDERVAKLVVKFIEHHKIL